MKKIFKPAVAVMIASMALTSCLDNDTENRQETTVSYGGDYCFNYVTDMQDGSSFISTAPQYTFVIDITNSKVNTAMTNVKLMSDASGLAFKLPEMNLTFSSNEYRYGCSGINLTPEGSSSQYVFDSFSFSTVERNIKFPSGIQYAPIYDIRFTVNGRYNVVTYPTTYYLLGTTEATRQATDSEEESSYSYDESIVAVAINAESMKASLRIEQARFASSMPGTALTIENLPVTFNRSGFTIDTPDDTTYPVKNAGREIENCSISDIYMYTAVPAGTTTLSFHIDLSGLQSNPVITPCDVTASLSYYYTVDNN